ncbi:MAG: SIMPL domain-containing protein [Limnochordia bacterium]|jgi:uncharacterized protein YggE
MSKSGYRLSVLITCLILISLSTAVAFGNNPGRLTVYGEAEAALAPDQARISVGVETQDADARKAVADNATLMAEVLKWVENYGPAVGAISTGSYQVYPWQQDNQTYYRVSNQLTVTVGELDRIGELIDGMIAAGANRVNWIQFEVRDSEGAKLEALGRAVKQAEQKAKILAEAAGVNIEGILSIREEGGSYTPYVMADTRAFALAAKEATEIRPGDVDIRARVAVEYKIAPATSKGEGEPMIPAQTGPSLAELGQAIPASEVTSIVIRDFSGEVVRSFQGEAIEEIIDSLNSHQTYNGMYPMILVGHQGTITLRDGSEIRLTSWGSREHVILNGEVGGEPLAVVVKSPHVGALLLGELDLF